MTTPARDDLPPRRERSRYLVAVFEQRIRREELAAGTRLPSVRECARLHGVSASTVVSAYERLQAIGLVEARSQRGYFVQASAAGGPSNTSPGNVQRPLAAPVDASALIRGMLRSADAPRGPGLGTLPVDWLDGALVGQALRHALRDSEASLRYGEPMGDPTLRAALARAVRDFGMPATAEQVLTTAGATHALDLLARTLLKPGDAVLVDDPGWAVEFARLTRLGMRLVPVPRDADGPDPGAFQAALEAERPRVYVTVSVLHNPTGGSLTPARAHALCKLADAYDLTIVEDDTYGWFEPSAPRLAALDGLTRTVYVGGISKVLAPDWRLGYLIGPAQLVERCAETKLLETLASPALQERAFAWVLGQGRMRRHVERLAARLDGARSRAIRHARGAGCRFVSPPRGLFGWLDVGIDTDRLAERLATKEWLIAPGRLFYATPQATTLMRVNFATAQDVRFWRELVKARSELGGRSLE